MEQKAIKILLVEDSHEDAELSKREARKVLPGCEFRLVETRETFLTELGTFQPDLILSDYSMPVFDGLTALRLALAHSPDTPVIIVTGSVNEDTAVDCMKAGASNYVIKEQMRRLGPAILHSLAEKKEKIELKQAEEALKASDKRFRSYIEHAPDGVFVTDETGKFLMVNEAACLLTGYSQEELLEMNISDLVFPEDIGDVQISFKTAEETGRSSIEIPYRTRDGKRKVWVVKAVKLGDDRFLGITHDITVQKNVEEALKKSENRFRELFENAPMAYQSLNSNGEYIDLNQELCNLLGYSESELLGSSFGKLWTHETTSLFPEKLHCLINEGHISGELSLVKKGGDVITVLLEGRTQTDKDDHFLRTHCILVDITARKKMEAELIEAKEKAVENDRLKTAFLNNISHEVRTPLNGIMGFSSLLNDPLSTPGERDYYVRIINQSGERLVSVINDIISMAMLETKQETTSENRFDLLRLMNEVFTTFQPRFGIFEVYFNYRPGISPAQALIISDEYKIRQILNNLIGNALKFTSKGKVEFGCTVDGPWLTFFVKDTGIGIDPGDITHIYERFWKSQPNGSKMFEGTGLGLAICKAYVELLGGRIWVDSEPGVGSTFWFSIPYRRGTEQPEEKPLQVQQEKSGEKAGRTILVADDEYDNYLLLEIILQKHNYRLIHAWNGKEAVDECRKNPLIDFILMDLKMPVMDGLEATQEIKAMRPGLPVIAVTAYAMSGDESIALTGGCDGYLSKPVKKEVLLEKLKQLGLQ
ncbi:MAG: response regulator [Bacteroidota bacterium]